MTNAKRPTPPKSETRLPVDGKRAPVWPSVVLLIAMAVIVALALMGVLR
jgi:hypothetical protein